MIVMFYQELTILPDAEMSVNHIWERLYKQLHIALASQMDDNNKGKIGVSFPKYENGKIKRLGDKLRVFAYDKTDLKKLNLETWLRAYRDYVHITSIRTVPEHVNSFAVYRRVHQEPNPQAKARRFAKRHDVTYEEALKLFPPVSYIDLPFVRMVSETNKRKYTISIEKIPQDAKVFAGFGSFGLDNLSTVPEF